jgi:hypothetical protein
MILAYTSSAVKILPCSISFNQAKILSISKSENESFWVIL